MILRFGLDSPVLSTEEDDEFPAGEEEAEGEDVPCFAGDFPEVVFPEGAGACCTRRLVLSHSTV